MKILHREKRQADHARHPGIQVDTELAVQLRDGRQEALARLLDRHLGGVYKYLYRRLGPGYEPLIAETVEATFTEALRRMRPFARGTARTPLRLWLLRLANRQLAQRRARLRAVPGTKDEGQALQASEDVELANLRAIMRTLPSRQGAVLALALFEELPAEEIAFALGVTPARAMRLLRGALRRVEAALERAD